MTFQRFHARLKIVAKINTWKKRVHLFKLYREISESPARSDDNERPASERKLRGNERRQMEHGFGVAGMNCFAIDCLKDVACVADKP